MAMITGGELVVRTLIKANVKNIFGLHGAHLETIFQACLDHHIPMTDTRHEAAAGHAAEGYARATRGLGVAMATAGPGFTNIITSIANAYLDRTPVLYITGSAGLAQAENEHATGRTRPGCRRHSHYKVGASHHRCTRDTPPRGTWSSPRNFDLLAPCFWTCRWTCWEHKLTISGRDPAVSHRFANFPGPARGRRSAKAAGGRGAARDHDRTRSLFFWRGS